MRILIVDDSRVCRMLYRKELNEGGYETIEAKDGVEALKVIQETEVDLVILDIEMPNMNGYEVCERLRSKEFITRFHQKKEVLPVIFVTSDTTMEGRVKSFNKGATDFITKGFKSGTLLSVVDSILKPGDPMEGLTALIVDQSRFMRKMIAGFLVDEGVRVLEAEDGEKAFDLLFCQPDKVNMVITDLELPGMKGDELCIKIRKDLGLKGVPVIILTDKEDRLLLVSLFGAGITDYLVKPFEKEELLARLRVSLETINALERQIQERIKEEANVSQHLAAKHARVVDLAEHATAILHNIGNVLNSVYVSCYQVSKQIKNSKLRQMLLAHQLITDHQDNLGEFFEKDVKGRMLPEYLKESGQRLKNEQMTITREIDDITTKVSLMKDIIKEQQAEAKCDDRIERVSLENLAREALKTQSNAIEKNNISVRHHFSEPELVNLPRVTFTHVIINLLKNAIEAMRDAEERVLTLKTGKDAQQRFYLEVTDTGSGIPEEHLKKIFNHGFTTKKDGHGFGLSYCAKAMREMGGSLNVESNGKGTVFTALFPASHEAETRPVTAETRTRPT